MITLKLISKTETKQGDMYNFLYNNKKTSQNYNNSVRLIQSVPPQNRNCRIIRGIISLKQGVLPVYPMQKRKQNVLRIYTKKRYCNSLPFIESADGEFIRLLGDMNFFRRHSDIIKKTDNAVIVDYNTRKIETPYGIASLTDLSTGLKTLLIAYYCLEQKKSVILNADECGDNILELLYRLVADTDIILYISHAVACLPEEYTYIVNGTELEDSMDFFDCIE